MIYTVYQYDALRSITLHHTTQHYAAKMTTRTPHTKVQSKYRSAAVNVAVSQSLRFLSLIANALTGTSYTVYTTEQNLTVFIYFLYTAVRHAGATNSDNMNHGTVEVHTVAVILPTTSTKDTIIT